MLNTHSHTCPNPDCGFCWQHTPGEFNDNSVAENQKAHTCPECGTEQYWKDVETDYDAPIHPSLSDAPDFSVVETIKRYAKTQKGKLSRAVRTAKTRNARVGAN